MRNLNIPEGALIASYITEKRVSHASELPQEELKRNPLARAFKEDGEKYSDNDACLAAHVYREHGTLAPLIKAMRYKRFFVVLPCHILIKEFHANGDDYYVRFSERGDGDIEWTLSKRSEYLPAIAAGNHSPRLSKEDKEELLRIKERGRSQYICFLFWKYKKKEKDDGWHVEALPKGGGVTDAKNELVRVINEMSEEEARCLLEHIRRDEAAAKSSPACAPELGRTDSNSGKDIRRCPSSQSLFPDANIPYSF